MIVLSPLLMALFLCKIGFRNGRLVLNASLIAFIISQTHQQRALPQIPVFLYMLGCVTQVLSNIKGSSLVFPSYQVYIVSCVG